MNGADQLSTTPRMNNNGLWTPPAASFTASYLKYLKSSHELRANPRILQTRPNIQSQCHGGKACIRGMRITASLVVNLVANGMTVDEILLEYPDLEPEDIRQALSYASALANEEVHPFASPAA